MPLTQKVVRCLDAEDAMCRQLPFAWAGKSEIGIYDMVRMIGLKLGVMMLTYDLLSVFVDQELGFKKWKVQWLLRG